ncbi:hypothetical protein ABZ468_54015 [Streptomyces sp. NPDC005708]|uniref:hypothetical protein n=1 Tax=Streptomyces sp. NPDC005708 TaxID=3154564 RepID=UPI0033E036A5
MHQLGYTLSNEPLGTVALKSADNTVLADDADVEFVVEFVDAVARRELGLSAEDAEYLFHPCRTRAEVLDALQQLADGADAIDQYAILDKGGDPSS